MGDAKPVGEGTRKAFVRVEDEISAMSSTLCFPKRRVRADAVSLCRRMYFERGYPVSALKTRRVMRITAAFATRCGDGLVQIFEMNFFIRSTAAESFACSRFHPFAFLEEIIRTILKDFLDLECGVVI